MSEDDDMGIGRMVLDYFLACFPPIAMKNIIHMTNKKLEEDEQPEMGMGELRKFFGVLILVTRFEFRNLRDLQSPNSNNQSIPTPAIGMTIRMSNKNISLIFSLQT
jgi:Transposase IS4